MSDAFMLTSQHTDADGNVWKLGNILAAPRLTWPEFGAVPKTRLIPRSQWKAELQGMDVSVGDIWQHPIADQNGYGMCFPEDAIVQMADNTLKPISKIRTGDMVLSAEGRICGVTKTMVRKFVGGMIDMRLEGDFPQQLVGTPEHPILTRRGYMPMSELRVGVDEVASPDWHCSSAFGFSSHKYSVVKELSETPHADLVYNFEVEGDHSYVVEGVCVHNCNCSGTATAIEKARARQGLPHVQLSGGDLYRRIAVGGRDNGSLLEDGLREAMENGVASTDVVPYLDWQRDYGQAAVQSRKKYRVLEAYLCPTFDHAFSAALMGFPLIIGIMWYDNFRVDSEGWLPARGSGGAGGHAFCGDKPVERNGVYGIACPNSWTPRWGANGRFVMPETLFGREISGTWAIGSVVTEDGDIPAPK